MTIDDTLRIMDELLLDDWPPELIRVDDSPWITTLWPNPKYL